MDNGIRPKQYSHVDYEALLIYVMKHRISISKALEEHRLDMARSTVKRNINKIKKEGINEIIDLYQNGYVPNMQKEEMPKEIEEQIELLPEKSVVVKDELKDLYDKLLKMKQIVDQCDGNVSEATMRINSGNTILGKVKSISVQGLRKNIIRFEQVKKALEQKEKEKSVKNDTEKGEK